MSMPNHRHIPDIRAFINLHGFTPLPTRTKEERTPPAQPSNARRSWPNAWLKRIHIGLIPLELKRRGQLIDRSRPACQNQWMLPQRNLAAQARAEGRIALAAAAGSKPGGSRRGRI